MIIKPRQPIVDKAEVKVEKPVQEEKPVKKIEVTKKAPRKLTEEEEIKILLEEAEEDK